jgi:hypothetical protein
LRGVDQRHGQLICQEAQNGPSPCWPAAAPFEGTDDVIQIENFLLERLLTGKRQRCCVARARRARAMASRMRMSSIVQPALKHASR